MGFNESDSYIQFGIEATASYNFLGTALAEPSVWALNVSDFLVANITTYSSTPGYALIDSTA